MKTSHLVSLVIALGATALAEEPPAPPPKPKPLVFIGLNREGAEEWLRTKDGATVVRVPRGEYLRRPYEPMGTSAEPKKTEVESCFMDKFEVTNARFARFLGERGGDVSKLWSADVPGIVRDGASFAAAPGQEEFPVTAATGLGALAYAEWAGGRIPRQIEWEKAAGGPMGRTFPWGDEAPDASRANFGRPAPRGPDRVGSRAAGASYYGCMDMAGNVYDRVLVERGGRTVPAMLKGGSWASPHPLNLRVLDLCMQPLDVADRTVGFRVAMDDPEPGRPTTTAAAPATLKIATDFDAAVAEAARRGVPVFLSLLYDTCGQCDRTREQLFRDPRFVAYCNENIVVILGHQPGDAMDDPHPSADDGACPLYPGVTCKQHMTIFSQGLAVVGAFVVSPGNFVLDPRRIKNSAGDAAVLVKEMDLPKWGNPVDAYLAAFERARAAMAEKPPAEAVK